jgi:hypothetical protein
MQMRPPVVGVNSNSPLREKSSEKSFMKAKQQKDEIGWRVQKRVVLANFTSDGKIVNNKWDKRHHVTPSQFNIQNKVFHKVSA